MAVEVAKSENRRRVVAPVRLRGAVVVRGESGLEDTSRRKALPHPALLALVGGKHHPRRQRIWIQSPPSKSHSVFLRFSALMGVL